MFASKLSQILNVILLMAVNSTLAVHAQADTQQEDTAVSLACPEVFLNIPLYPHARLCQVFSDLPPASLSYHADADIEQTKAFYQDKFMPADSTDQLNGRWLLQYENSNKIIVISPDGTGAQVDILVKAASAE